MKVEATYGWEKSPNIPPGPHRQYVDLTVVNSKGNPYAPDIGGSYIIGIDAKTGEAKFWQVPTPQVLPAPRPHGPPRPLLVRRINRR